MQDAQRRDLELNVRAASPSLPPTTTCTWHSAISAYIASSPSCSGSPCWQRRLANCLSILDPESFPGLVSAPLGPCVCCGAVCAVLCDGDLTTPRSLPCIHSAKSPNDTHGAVEFDCNVSKYHLHLCFKGLTIRFHISTSRYLVFCRTVTLLSITDYSNTATRSWPSTSINEWNLPEFLRPSNLKRVSTEKP